MKAQITAEKWEKLPLAERQNIVEKWHDKRDAIMEGISVAAQCSDLHTGWLEAIGFKRGRLVHVTSDTWTIQPVNLSESLRLFVKMEAKSIELDADGHADSEGYAKWLKLLARIV
jgi:hypothetical protein